MNLPQKKNSAMMTENTQGLWAFPALYNKKVIISFFPPRYYSMWPRAIGSCIAELESISSKVLIPPVLMIENQREALWLHHRRSPVGKGPSPET